MENADLPPRHESEKREPIIVGEVSFNEHDPIHVITFDEDPNLRSKFALYDQAGNPIADVDQLHLFITPIDTVHPPGQKTGIFDKPPKGHDPRTLFRRFGVATGFADPPIIGTTTILGVPAEGRLPHETDPELTQRIRDGWGVEDWSQRAFPEQQYGNWGWGLHLEHSIGQEALDKLGIRPEQLFEGTGAEMKKQESAAQQVIARAVDLGAQPYKQAKYRTGMLPGTLAPETIARRYGAPPHVLNVAVEGKVKIDRFDKFEPPIKPGNQ